MHLLPVLIPLVATFVGMVGAIVNIVGFLRPGRIPRPRRMVNYRVHYDDSLGTSPDIKGVAELVVPRRGHDVPDASLAMIRISNEGGLDIGPEHWILPITFTFDGRDVVGVEVSDADGVPRGLLTGDQEPAESAGGGGTGVGVRRAVTEGETIQISKGKKALELPRIELKRRDRIRLLVLLSGAREGLRAAVEGGAYIKDAVRGGGLVREETPRRQALYTFGWTGFALVSLVVAMLVTFITRPFSTTAAAAACVPGTIVVAGSTAFAPSVVDVEQRLRQDCPSSVVKVNPGGSTIGSLGAASDLEDSGSSAAFRNANMVISDGAVPAAEYPGLVGHPVAVVIFAVVVNRATGVSSLTESQLDGIWTGRYKNWRQLVGANLPIDIVSRNTDSGTRATFDHKILRMATEIPQSSQSCTSRDLIPASPVIRCEKSSTGQLLEAVNAIPGAVGYAEAHVAERDQAAKYPNLDVVLLAGRDPSAEAVNAGPNSYPFWAVEYMCTYGTPAPGSLLSAFLGYMSTDAAKSSLQNDGEIPCSLTRLCPPP